MTEPASILAELPLLEQAIKYATRGWFVFPVHSVRADGSCSCGRACGRPGKHPRTPNGYKDATLDLELINAWWKQWPDANIGIDCGRSNLLIVDVDPRNAGDDTLAELEMGHGALPTTLTINTGGGGQHYYFDVLAINNRQRSRVLGQGVELKADGGYVVAPPSTHISGKKYEFDYGQSEEPQFPPNWLVDSSRRARYTESASEPLEGIIGVAFSAAGLLGRPLGPDRCAVKCPWDGDHTNRGDANDTSTVVFGPAGKSKWGWFYCSHAHCQERLSGYSGVARMHEVLKALPVEAAKLAATRIPSAERELKRVTRAEWEKSIVWEAKGLNPVGNAGNLKLMMDNLPEWQGTLAFDESKDRLFWSRKPPEVVGLPYILQGQNVGESDWIYVSQWFLRERGMRVDKGSTQDVIAAVGQSNTHNSLIEYLDSVQWDGINRLDMWLHVYCGADDSEYNKRIGRAWIISAVARAYEPGVQVDHTLVFEGPQGAGKTSVFRVLGGEWYLGNLPRLEDKDSQHILSGSWIVEIQELAGVRVSLIEKVKAYLSERWDQYRPPYARGFVKRPRRCIFGASTNEGEYINDSTGARRFWPVVVGQIKVDDLTRDRNQLFAEAKMAYSQGERHWFTPEELVIQGEIREQQALRMHGDPWEATIMDYARAQKTNPVFTEDILTLALRIEPGRQTGYEGRRVGGILRANKYLRVRESGGKRRWCWVSHSGTAAALRNPFPREGNSNDEASQASHIDTDD